MKEFKCEVCSKSFGNEESLKQHTNSKHGSSEGGKINKKKNIKKYGLLLVLFLALVIFSYTFYVKSQKPGDYDGFAKCLTEKGAVVYGNDYCQYTNKQLNFFGKSAKYLNYVKCIDNTKLCDSKGVKITPTWEIDGEMYEQVQSFEKLSELSRCEL